MLAYLLMNLFFLTKKSRGTPNSKWMYALSSVFDATALSTSIKAFQMTLIASVTMLTVLAVVTTTFLSVVWLKVRYFWFHYVAILICIAGVIVTIYSDFFDSEGNFNFGTFWGDILAIISAFCYGVTSVISDYLVKSGSNNYAI